MERSHDHNGPLASKLTRQASTPEELLPLIYDDLRRVAASKLASQPTGHTLQPTELVHDAWIRLKAGQAGDPVDRGHFFGKACEAMRHILVDHARRKQAERHGGRLKRTAYYETNLEGPVDEDQIIEVHEALEELERDNKLSAELVKLKFFGGMTLAEAAQILGVSARTADSLYAVARTILLQKIKAKLS